MGLQSTTTQEEGIPTMALWWPDRTATSNALRRVGSNDWSNLAGVLRVRVRLILVAIASCLAASIGVFATAAGARGQNRDQEATAALQPFRAEAEEPKP
jgi:ribose/xylose/arabinose/galactoside ABC-type transport system permease subunit